MKNGPSYIHKKGRCSDKCPFYTVEGKVNHTLRDICDLTGRRVEHGKSKCLPYLSDQAKKKETEEPYCPRCGLTKGELPAWKKWNKKDGE